MTSAAERAPLFGCDAPDRLPYSRLERELLEAVRHHSESEFNRFVLRKNDRELARELCFERRNGIQWLPVAKTETVLEIGAGAGALTGAWADKAARVVAVELSPARAAINAIRQRGRDNVEIHAGAFAETERRLADRKFHVIALIGSLGAAADCVGPDGDPRQRLLERLRPRLADGGWIVVAAPNRFGLKFWAGGAEDDAEPPFGRLESQTDAAASGALSRAELAQLARDSGFASAVFFYPHPDFRFPSCIYSDERLPRPGELGCNAFPWDARQSQLFQPGKTFDELIRENQFPFFANSFLAVLAPEAPRAATADGRRIVYAKFSTMRRPERRIRTDLLVDERGAPVIRKSPTSAAGQAHVAGLQRHFEQLSRLCAGTRFAVNRCELRAGGAEFEFLAGPTLADEALDRLRRNDRAGFLAAMADFCAAVQALATEEFRPTAEFRAVFGAVRLPPGLKSASVTDVDLILPNLIARDGRWHVIDYEWTFDFPIPVGYVLYRTFRYLYSYNEWIGRKFGGLHRELYRLAGIAGDVRRYKRMEWALQQHLVPRPGFVQDLAPHRQLRLRPDRLLPLRNAWRRLPPGMLSWLARAQAWTSDLP